MTEAKQKGTIKLFSCGGAGINIGKTFEDMRGKDNPMFAILDIAYLDTSPANLKDPALPRAAIYQIPGVDGSGQVRKENAELIFAHAPAMLEKFKPADFNIVVHSLSGGSGSVIGPALVSEMTGRGIPVVAIGIGETDTIKHMENTHMSLLSYINIALTHETPVVSAYFHNSNLTPEADVNDGISRLITALSVLFSRENISMDSRDLFNWLNFNKVSDFGPQLALLSLFESTAIDAAIGNIITVATLATEGGDASVGQMVEYQKVGRLPEVPPGVESPVHMTAPIHFVVSDGVFDELVGKLDAELTEYKRKAAARVPKTQQDLLKNKTGGKNGVMV